MNVYSNIQLKIKQLEKQLSQSVDVLEQVDCMNELAGELFVYDIDKPQHYCREARKIAELHHYKKGIATSFNKEALCCRIRSDFKKSILLSREAYALFESLDDETGQADSLN
ncbi:MAG TPA: hypothetical protein PLD84_00885, partial [Chitinophagales bacterium]|nr:hypothetical protein [Chitinophagales bacterium]